MDNKTILCVEDNMAVQMMNKPLLEDKGFTVKLAMTLREAREAMALEMPCLIILDVHLPDGNGLDFLRELRQTSNVPVIALTNNKEEQDVVEGFDSGCNDYIPKPHSFPVMYARIEALLKSAEQVPETVTRGALALKIPSMAAFLHGRDLLLTQKEFAMLLLFVQNEGKTMSADFVYGKVWGQDMIDDNRTLKKHISALRDKIAGSGYAIPVIRNEGYRFEKEV